MATCPTCRLHHPDGTKVCTVDGDNLLPDEAFTSADADLKEGEVAGEYRLEAKLGEGGFGSVYRGVHTLIGKIAAIKVLHRAYSSSPQIVSRFIAEARSVNQIRHKNIIDIFAFGVIADGRHYFVMELLEGESLEGLLRREERLAPAAAAPMLRAVARALTAAHAAGIAHRDLKPDNVFLARDDGELIPKLLDFGIAKLMGEDVSGHKTRTGAPIGTPAYMSPEQCRGLAIDHRTDVYSFGILIFRALTGRMPFDAQTALDLMFKHIHETPPKPSELCPDLPAAVDAPLLAMLAKDPANRPASVEAALEAVLSALGVPPTITMPGEPSSRERPGPPPQPSSNPGVRVITDGKLASPTFVDAKTIADSAPQPVRTLVGSERDVGGAARGGRRPWVALGVAGAVAIGGVGVLLGLGLRGEPSVPSGAGVVVQPPLPPGPSALPPPSASAASSAQAPGAPPASATPAPDPDKVEIRVTGAPKGAQVLDGTKVLGSASTPLTLPFGRKPLKLTLAAAGFRPAPLEVTPDRAQDVPAPPLVPLGASGLRREVEDPFR